MGNNNTELRTLIINRNEWNRGNSVSSLLYNATSHLKCCLGFECLSLGVAKEDIQDKGSPFAIRNYSKYENIIKHLVGLNKFTELYNTDFVLRAIYLNDCKLNFNCIGNNMIESETQREQLLSEHFLTIGVKLEFIN